jgi:hypothetical protein
VGEGSTVMNTADIIQAWEKILKGEQPSISIEITREYPLNWLAVIPNKRRVGNNK